MKTNTALCDLRNMYRQARAGATLSAPAFAVAIVGAIVAGADTVAIVCAFEPFMSVRLDCVEGAEGATLVRAAQEQGGHLAALRVCSLLGWTDAWAAAMTAHFGPTGTHESRIDAEGRPSAETLAAFPAIGQRMAEGAKRFDNIIAWYERTGRATRWEHVIEMRRAAA